MGAGLFNDINDPKLTGLRVRPMADNTANTSADMNISNTKLLTTSDYRLDFDGTNYSARRLSDGAVMTLGTNAAGDLTFADSTGRDQGFTLQMNGTPAAGDRFILEPTRRGAADIRTDLKESEQLAFAAPFKSSADLQNKGNGTRS